MHNPSFAQILMACNVDILRPSCLLFTVTRQGATVTSRSRSLRAVLMQLRHLRPFSMSVCKQFATAAGN